jgi:hypothetical protein
MVRVQMIRRFAEWNGFSVLLNYFQQEPFVWPGADIVLILLKSVENPEVNDAFLSRPLLYLFFTF